MRRISDLPTIEGWSKGKENICKHPEHNPPMHIVLAPGVYEHECPGCGKVQMVIVQETLFLGVDFASGPDKTVYCDL